MPTSPAGWPVTPGAAAAYDAHRRQSADELVSAAENITYGDAERQPVRRLVDGFGQYGAAAAVARATPGAASHAALAEADRVLHAHLLPDADALDTANRDALNHGYADERTGAAWGTAWTVVAGLLLLASLVGTQAFLARRVRRMFSPPLVFATAVTVATAVWLLVALAASAEALRSAKVDAFDSISALTRARSVAVDAYATRLAGLQSSTGSAADADPLARPPTGLTLDAVVSSVDAGTVPVGFTGYLADELRNITFAGEQQAADDALRTYAAYLAAPPAGAAAAFNRFDDALGRTLDINQAAFDASVGQGFAALDGLGPITALSAAVTALAAYIGLRPRLREYAA